TKFLPDYPVQGHLVTIQHLLAHTSGIRNYTEVPEWQPTLRNDVSVQQLIDVFKDKPFDFPPASIGSMTTQVISCWEPLSRKSPDRAIRSSCAPTFSSPWACRARVMRISQRSLPD